MLAARQEGRTKGYTYSMTGDRIVLLAFSSNRSRKRLNFLMLRSHVRIVFSASPIGLP